MLKGAAPRAFDGTGKEVRLAAPPLGRGGEGTVYRVDGDAALLAKIYHRPTPERARKVAAMVQMAAPPLLAVSAWPAQALHPAPGAPAHGFLMRAAPGRQVHELYSPKSRLTAFSAVSWRFLLAAAANLARAVGTVQENGAIVGDLNHANCYVTERATAHLIDCDSFQIARGGELFRCPVGSELFTPPELQGARLAEVVRTPDHDAFGLAVLIFLLLWNGRHPFAGRFSGKGDMPLPRAIAEHRFAYGAGAAARQMVPPPYALPLAGASPRIAALFERAFAGAAGAAGAAGGPGTRPTAQEWVVELDELAAHLRVCAADAAHQFWQPLPDCPWCEIERAAGIMLFFLPLQAPAPSHAFDARLAWERIQRVPPPEPLGRLQRGGASTLPPSAEIRRYVRTFTTAAVTAAILLLVVIGLRPYLWYLLLVAIPAFSQVLRGKRTSLLWARQRMESRWLPLYHAYAREAAGSEFDRLLDDLEEAHANHANLPDERQRELAKVRDRARERQMHWFLRRFDLPAAKVAGIGPAKIAVLRSYGIESAADCDLPALLQVPGIGPAFAARLLHWRKTALAAFRFDAAQAEEPTDVRDIDRRLEVKRRRLEAQLTEGPEHLAHLRALVEDRRRDLRTARHTLAREDAQLTADTEALHKIFTRALTTWWHNRRQPTTPPRMTPWRRLTTPLARRPPKPRARPGTPPGQGGPTP